MSSFFNRIRSKSISSLNQITISQPGYCYVENFDLTTDEECMKIDTENLNLYRKNKNLYDEMSKKLETRNALFKIDKPPEPPREPNNYERYLKYKQRNIYKNVRLQTFAVQKLIEKGYKLFYDLVESKTELDFEPYQAIELLEKIENDLIENIFKNCYSTNSPQTPKKQLSQSPPMNIQSLPTPEYSYSYSYSYPQNSQYYPVYPNLSSSVVPSAPPALVPSSPLNLHRNVAPPASHYISNA